MPANKKHDGNSTARVGSAFAAWMSLPADGLLLFAARIARLFAYGFLSVVLVLYLRSLGVSSAKTGLLLTLTLAGDTVVSLWLTTSADRVGRRKMLVAGAGLMLLAGVLFAWTRSFAVLVFAATVGVISPGGNEIGPFLPIEQAALSQVVPASRHTQVFAWYNLVGSFATALGALCGGVLVQGLQHSGMAPLPSYRVVVVGYAAAGLALALLFLRLSPSSETPRSEAAAAGGLIHKWLGLHASRRVVMKFSALFALDAFGGGFVLQSLVVYWFHLRFGASPVLLGEIFFFANLLAGLSALAAAAIARRIGLLNTMVCTHIPSNLLLMLVPFMPTLPLAAGVLLLRYSISQMDVPTRQAYTMALVSPDERSGAAGVNAVARSVGAALSPSLAGLLLAGPRLAGDLFLLAGGLKIVYDLLLYVTFRTVHLPGAAQPLSSPRQREIGRLPARTDLSHRTRDGAGDINVRGNVLRFTSKGRITMRSTTRSTMRSTMRSTLLVIGIVVTGLILPQLAQAEDFGTVVPKFLGRSGKMTANAYVVPIPRSDLKESIAGFPLPTAFGFGGWVAFMRHGASTMVMADLPLKPSEIDAVIRTLDQRGIHATGLHNHFLGESEPIMFMHIQGMGSTQSLAAAIRAGLAMTSAPIPRKPAAPPASGLNNAAIERAAGRTGTVAGPGVFKIVVGRPELHITDMGVPMTTPLVNSWAAFTGSDSDAAVAGDMAMQASEIAPVVHALESRGLQVFAIHNHMSTDRPHIFFLHYYGRGTATALASAFRAALAQLHR